MNLALEQNQSVQNNVSDPIYFRMKKQLIYLLTFLIVLLNSTKAMADTQHQGSEELLTQMVEHISEIMRANDYKFPNYIVRNGATELPISEPIKCNFFAYTDQASSWVKGDPWTFVIQIYAAREIPVKARSDVIKYLVELHEARGGDFALSIRMIEQDYRKGVLISPSAFLEMKLEKLK